MSTYTDDFSDNSGNWLIKDDANISLQVEKGGYVIEHRQDSGWWATWKTFMPQPSSDLGIQVKIQRILGASNSFYGLVWNLVDVNNFNYLLVNPGSQFSIGRYFNNEWHNLIAWTTAPFDSDLAAVNDITLVILKGKLELHINGYLIFHCKWSDLVSGNKIGFIVGHTMKVKITKLTITTENSVQIPISIPFALSKITRTHVNSSNINSIGYDVRAKTLEIQFNQGSVYQYYQVPQEIYVGLMKAESHGQYFQAVIRGAFQSNKVGYEPIQDFIDYDDDGYSEEPSTPYTTRDLKYDLGMDFMSDDEFDTWYEDQGRD